MLFFKKIKIKSYEVGLYFRGGEFKRLLTAGRHWLFDPLWKVRVDVASQREPWLVHDKLDVVVKSGALTGLAKVVDLKDHERALAWIEGRFSHVLPPGLYAYWTGFKDVRVEVIDARDVRLEHAEFKTIVRSPHAAQVLDICSVGRNHVGVAFVDGEYVETLTPGQYAWWRGVADAMLTNPQRASQTMPSLARRHFLQERIPVLKVGVASPCLNTSMRMPASWFVADSSHRGRFKKSTTIQIRARNRPITTMYGSH